MNHLAETDQPQDSIAIARGRRMDLLPLIPTLIAVASHKGVRRAARTLGVSKSTVSRQVEALSDGFGVMLIDLEGPDAKLTQAGQALITSFAEVSKAFEALERRVDEAKAGAVGTVRLAIPAGLGSLLLPRLRSLLAVSSPGLELESVTPDRDLKIGRDADIAVLPFGARSPQLRTSRFLETREVLVASAKLSEQLKDAAPQRLEEQVWIRHVSAPISQVQELQLTTGGSVLVRPRQILDAHSIEVFLDWIESGRGLGLLPDWLLRDPKVASRVTLLPYGGRVWAYHAVMETTGARSLKLRSLLDALRRSVHET